MTYPVIFAGAGPGDPDLITVKAQHALMEADLVIYAGSLVPEAVLKWAKPDTPKLNSASMHLGDIIREMETAYRAERRVVRLHTGDPSLYGAIFEQMSELAKREIPYTVIPGVTAAFAAAAAMGIEYTLPEISQTLILTRMAGRTPVPEKEALARLASHQASMAIYLSISLTNELEEILKKAYGKDAPCVVAFRVSQPQEKIVWTRIGDLAKTVKEQDITHQAIIIVGKVLEVSLSQIRHYSKLYDKNFKHGYRGGE
ncbi:MAG: precorrin-4 C(11)-methyltransferase [Desulfobacteraceae bacterium IS3]|nr:MAG: precorrin-4 C(11)-methyltransferase [Desulfobacteraceae bacterium IS3]HAO19066.1 precorrin-4 C(11)-methyltransferase [Desulfobacteraceae bacterium]